MQTKKTNKLPIYLLSLVAILTLLFLPSIMYRLEESKYRNKFMQLPAVDSVQDYLNYDGLRMAELNIRDGGFLSIDKFDDSSFNSTSFIGLHRIGDLRIRCSSRSDKYDGLIDGINIIQLTNMSPKGPEIKNIPQLVNNYGIVYKYVKDNIPDVKMSAKEIQVGKEHYWCNVIKVDA